MKNIAISIMIVILLSVLVEPLVEVANVLREKVVVGSALTNACRAAKSRSLVYERQRDRDAEIDPDLFRDYFSEAFEDAMNVTRVPTAGTTMRFAPNDDKYNVFTVTLDLDIQTDFYTDQRVTKAIVKAESPYKFKTKYLKMAAAAGGTDYDLTAERILLLKVIN